MTDIERIRALCQGIIDEAAVQVDEVGAAGASVAVARASVAYVVIDEINKARPITAAERIPQRIRESLDNYERGFATGDCLRAVLEGDLYGAMTRADAEVMLAMPAIVAHIRCGMPAACAGSPDVVSSWLAARARS